MSTIEHGMWFALNENQSSELYRLVLSYTIVDVHTSGARSNALLRVYDTWLLSSSVLERLSKISRASCQAEASEFPGGGRFGGAEKGLK